jgi:Protein of unknown function (DUF3307)
MPWILAHLIGDFFFQTDWMAAKKKSASFVCGVHAIAYLLPFLLCGLTWWQMILIGVQHFAQDRWNFVPWFMKAKRSAGFMAVPLAPWSLILTDNILHCLWIWMVVSVFSRWFV